MARVTNAVLAQKIDSLAKQFTEFKDEFKGELKTMNGRQRGLDTRVTKLEATGGNPASTPERRLSWDSKPVQVGVSGGIGGLVLGIIYLVLEIARNAQIGG